MKIIFINNKKYWYALVFVIFFVIYYLFFVQGKIDLSLSARDMEIKTIDNRNNFEEIILKNIYNKIVESCSESRKSFYSEPILFNEEMNIDQNNEIRRSSELSVNSDILQNSVNWKISSFDSLSKSINFDWTETVSNSESNINFSKTNIQKQEIDEWDILKQTKDYIFYFSKIQSKVFIIKSPLNWEKIDLNNPEIVFSIDIPPNLVSNSELFVNENRLVYLSSKKSYNNNNTIVWIYDISNLLNKEVKLIKIFETKWEYFKSRLVDNNLYLVSDYSMYWFKSKYCNILKNDANLWIIDFISFFTWLKINWFWINQELFDELKNELESYSYKFSESNLYWTWYAEYMNLFKVFYTEKDLKDTIENLNFNIVSVIDIENKESKDTQTLLFWNLKNWEIHMSTNNLYLVNSYYSKEEFECEYIDICYKKFASNNFTSISKIAYSWKDLNYLKTVVVPWKPLTQYSMDEDEWYFRIVTAKWNSNRDASLHIFDQNFKLIWELENIKPWEEFKSSRFIWDKLFLVTFRAIDPLFVIDLHIPASPEIIWELEIPWFSTYLHPYWKIWNKDYLIWLWTENNNVKLDLYEIDYENIWLWWYIWVTQKYKYLLKWNSSTTSAMYNPRAFVFDKSDNTLYLPIEIEDFVNKEEECSADNSECFLSWVNFSSWDKTYNKKTNIIRWLKTFKINHDLWIEETWNYETNWKTIADSRVWYYKDKTSNSIFYVDWEFISFFKWNEEKNIFFK